jgi:DNA replication and repair protein RecF
MFNYRIKHIFIENIRNLQNFQLNLENHSTIFTGKNGVGKTSILEAISLIYPGNGLRGENYINILNNQSKKNFWKVEIIINDGKFDNKIQALYENGKKIIKINDKKVKNFNEILEYCRIFGITQDDYHQILTFVSFKRKFFDKMISQFFPDYYNYLVQYNYYINEKNKIFFSCGGKISDTQNLWLDELEKKLSKLNFLISSYRKDFILKFNEISNNFEQDQNFLPKIEIDCEIEDCQSEEEIFRKLKHNRQFFKKNFGIHVSKFNIFNNKNQINIDFLSSGEQRLILNKLIINFVKMQIQFNQIKPILLLDDILTFFDKKNQKLLIEEIITLENQCFITTNHLDDEIKYFENLKIIDLEKLEPVINSIDYL